MGKIISHYHTTSWYSLWFTFFYYKQIYIWFTWL